MSLRKLFEYVGDMLSMKIDVIVTDGSEPVGNGIGPVLEAPRRHESAALP